VHAKLRETGLAKGESQDALLTNMPQQYLDHKLECPYCLTIRLRIPADARPDTPISCDDCGAFLGLWDDLLVDFESQGGQNGVFRLDKGRIKKID
jgi:hypothetical protein